MAVFPILMVVCLRWGLLAGWLTLIGGVTGAWYIYLGQPFSFIVNQDEVRALITAFAVGVLIIALCTLLKTTNANLRAANAASQALAQGLSERTRELGDTNIALSDALAERIRMQETLATSEAQFRASFENAAVGKVQSDPVSGRIVRVNKALATMLGYEIDELIGQDGWTFTVDEDKAGDRAEYQEMLAGRANAYIREKRFIRRDGDVIWGRVSATLTRSPTTGEPVMASAVVENIDDQYKAKVALESANRDLSDLLEERTTTLSQRDVLLREVYHRVKNNLQIVDSLLVMQRRHIGDPEARDALEALRSRVYALGLVHHQLMGSSDLKTFDVAPFLEELTENLRRGGAAKGVSLSVRASPLKVGLDFAIPLGLIVTELVTNSMKHAFPQGAGTIEVVLEIAQNGMVVLIVSDDGVGISMNASTTANRSSIGDTIVQALVNQLRGVMQIRSDRGYSSEIQFPDPVAI